MHKDEGIDYTSFSLSVCVWVCMYVCMYTTGQKLGSLSWGHLFLKYSYFQFGQPVVKVLTPFGCFVVVCALPGVFHRQE